MAPEVVNTEGKVTEKWDIWSLGWTIIELLTGKAPNVDKNPFQVCELISNEEMPIPEEFSEVWMLSKIFRN